MRDCRRVEMGYTDVTDQLHLLEVSMLTLQSEDLRERYQRTRGASDSGGPRDAHERWNAPFVSIRIITICTAGGRCPFPRTVSACQGMVESARLWTRRPRSLARSRRRWFPRDQDRLNRPRRTPAATLLHHLHR